MMFSGKAHAYSDNVNTDVIIPARYLTTSDPAVMAAHCMEDIDLDFVANMVAGDIVVAGENFGCGSSREHAPIALKASGVSCIIAVSFARIFYRNAINIGLPILECPDAAYAIADGDSVTVDTDAGTIIDISTGAAFSARPFPPFIAEIIAAGGLIPRTKEQLAEETDSEPSDLRASR